MLNKSSPELSKEVDRERVEMTYKGKSISQASLWSRALFSWTYPMIRYARGHQLNINLMGEIQDKDKVELQLEKLKLAWEVNKRIEKEEN